MTPFAKENRVTSIFGYREFYLNGKLVKGQHNGIDEVVIKSHAHNIQPSLYINYIIKT